MKVKIKVTQADIDNGKSQQCQECPIALAFLRLPGVRIVRVGSHGGGVWIHQKFFTFMLTAKAARFVFDFDCGKPVKPFPFTATLEDNE